MNLEEILKGIIFFVEIPIILICVGLWYSFIFNFAWWSNIIISFGIFIGITISLIFGIGVIVARF